MVGKAVDQGVEFVICTGRGVYGVERFLEKLHLLGRPGYVICQNGAAVYNLENMEMVLKHSFLLTTCALWWKQQGQKGWKSISMTTVPFWRKSDPTGRSILPCYACRYADSARWTGI